jgi:hypothetical protein
MAEKKQDTIDTAAQAMAKKRWAGTTKAERSDVARALNEARWGKKGKGKRKAAAPPADRG